MNRIFVTDSTSRTGLKSFPDDVVDLRQQHIERMENAWRPDANANDTTAVDALFADRAEPALDGRDLHVHRMENAWKTADSRTSDDDVGSRDRWLARINGALVSPGSNQHKSTIAADESGLSGPELQAYRMSNAWRLPPQD